MRAQPVWAFEFHVSLLSSTWINPFLCSSYQSDLPSAEFRAYSIYMACLCGTIQSQLSDSLRGETPQLSVLTTEPICFILRPIQIQLLHESSAMNGSFWVLQFKFAIDYLQLPLSTNSIASLVITCCIREKKFLPGATNLIDTFPRKRPFCNNGRDCKLDVSC